MNYFVLIEYPIKFYIRGKKMVWVYRDAHILFSAIISRVPRIKLEITFNRVSFCGFSSLKKMRKQRFKTTRLLLKLMLLLQIYSHHKFTFAEATENNFSANFDKCKVGDETGSNDQISETEESVLERPKRPARLLPLKMIL